MTESNFRSRYAGMPGSLVAIRVDYARRGVAFDSLAPESGVAVAKRDVKRWKMGHRLGDKAEWNNSAQPEGYIGGAPQRPLLHQLSEYQGIKLEYNFRSSTLPVVNHATRFVPKASKLQVDRAMFMTEKERGLLTDTNQGTATHLSRNEMANHSLPGVEREAGWNTSTLPQADRTNIYKLRDYERFLDVNKTKDVLDHSRYVPPQKRQEIVSRTERDLKLSKRDAAQAAATQNRGSHSAPHGASSASDPLKVYKMSNINEWWDEDFDSKMLATASAVLGRPVVGAKDSTVAGPSIGAAAGARAGTEGNAGASVDP